ncbi:hypothetical protein ACF1BK_24925 [Streptomyces globisporus]|uniref:hypothetical protein n=1 Tax=Streptomyces globisporus TaxID=1908 RepID=UPI0037008BEC
MRITASHLSPYTPESAVFRREVNRVTQIDPVHEGHASYVLTRIYHLSTRGGNSDKDGFVYFEEFTLREDEETATRENLYRAGLIDRRPGASRFVRLTEAGRAEVFRLFEESQRGPVRSSFCTKVILYAVQVGQDEPGGENRRWERRNLITSLSIGIDDSISLAGGSEVTTLAGSMIGRNEWADALDSLLEEGYVTKNKKRLKITKKGLALASSGKDEVERVSENHHHGDVHNYNAQNAQGPISMGPNSQAIQNNHADLNDLAKFAAAVRREALNWQIDPRERAELVRDAEVLAEVIGSRTPQPILIRDAFGRVIMGLTQMGSGAADLAESGQKIFNALSLPPD